MFGRALVGVLLTVACALVWAPNRVLAQDPESASAAAACQPGATDCVAGVRDPQGPRVIPSAPSELAEGHSDQSVPILLGLALVSLGGLVVSILNRMALDER